MFTRPTGPAPTISTARLEMRAHRLDDFEPSAALWRDDEIVRNISGAPSTREQSWSRVLRYAGHWALLGYGYWAVIERESGRFAGEVGFANYQREIEPSLDATPELGWVLAAHARGRGYASEAVDAAIGWARQNMRGVEAIACIIGPDNERSIRVAQRAGFELKRHATYHGDPILVYERTLS